MADIITPIAPRTAVQVERRCSHVVCSNDLDSDSTDPTTKYRITLTVWDEEQDADANLVGARKRVADKTIPMAQALAQEFTAGGVTLTGAAILALFNEVVDAYKGDAT